MTVELEEGIDLKVDVRKNLLQSLDYTDLTSLFCNLLDNAMEACVDIEDPIIELSVTKKENTDITLISMINTCRIRPEFDKNGFPVSTKDNKMKHGYGLKSVNKIIRKYNGDMKMYVEEDKLFFHTIIILKCPDHRL